MDLMRELNRPWTYEDIENGATVLCYVLDVGSSDIQRTYDRALAEAASLLEDLETGQARANDPRMTALLMLDTYAVAPMWCPEHEEQINAVVMSP